MTDKPYRRAFATLFLIAGTAFIGAAGVAGGFWLGHKDSAPQITAEQIVSSSSFGAAVKTAVNPMLAGKADETAVADLNKRLTANDEADGQHSDQIAALTKRMVAVEARPVSQAAPASKPDASAATPAAEPVPPVADRIPNRELVAESKMPLPQPPLAAAEVTRLNRLDIQQKQAKAAVIRGRVQLVRERCSENPSAGDIKKLDPNYLSDEAFQGLLDKHCPTGRHSGFVASARAPVTRLQPTLVADLVTEPYPQRATRTDMPNHYCDVCKMFQQAQQEVVVTPPVAVSHPRMTIQASLVGGSSNGKTCFWVLNQKATGMVLHVGSGPANPGSHGLTSWDINPGRWQASRYYPGFVTRHICVETSVLDAYDVESLCGDNGFQNFRHDDDVIPSMIRAHDSPESDPACIAGSACPPHLR